MIATMMLSDVTKYMPGKLIGRDVEFSSVTTDSREILGGDLFVALVGERFDGNQFVEEVARKNAAAAIVSAQQNTDLPQLLVADTAVALGWLGHINRKRSNAKVMAITGSQGKTTVKEITGTILQQHQDVLVTRGNLNNTIGAPLMLLKLSESHQAAVIELGANAPGEIAWTAMLCDPHIVLINNATETHLEGFGSLNGVVRAKGEIIDAAASTHTVVLNADDPSVKIWQSRAGERRCVTFSMKTARDRTVAADYYVESLELSPGGSTFELQSPVGKISCFLPLPGAHNVANALAASALCIEAGTDLRIVSQGLAKVAAVPGRLRPCAGICGSQLLDDTYNASPSSFKAAIDVLLAISETSGMQSVVIAGDMAEMGDNTVQAHEEVGRYARDKGVAALWTVGKYSQLTAAAYGSAARHFADKAALLEFAEKVIDRNYVILIKGSRSAGMDTITKQLSSEEKI
jgi:UDP-N-acetylmuramoyl-tripeptide--D-alanyl-D-alanine ligase